MNEIKQFRALVDELGYGYILADDPDTDEVEARLSNIRSDYHRDILRENYEPVLITIDELIEDL